MERPGSRSATSAATGPTSEEVRRRRGGADEEHRLMETLQKTTDKHVAEVDRVGATKEQEVLEV